MFGFIIKLKLDQIKNQPIKLVGYFFILLFVFFNLYAIQFISDDPSFPDINIRLYISVFPIMIVLISDFLFRYKFNVILLSKLYPVSNIKNAGISLFNEFFRYVYVIALTILIELFLIFDFSFLEILEIIFLLVNVAVLKFFIHYLIWKINVKSVNLFVLTILIFVAHLYLYLAHSLLFIQILLLVFQLVIYFTRFKKFRYDYFVLKRIAEKRNVGKSISWVLFYGLYEYKSLFFLYFIVKIGFILTFSIYYNITGKIFISPLALMVVLSPIFLFTYFHNNFYILNYRINKNLYLVLNDFKIVGINLLIILISSLIDLVLSLPAFIVFELNYLLNYSILFFSFMLSSVFISLYFPKEKKTSDLWFKGTTSTIGTILFFFYIAFVVNPIYDFRIKMIPVIVSVVIFIIAIINFNKKQVLIFENYKY